MDGHVDVDVQKHMQQHTEQLSQDMAQLVYEVEQRSQEQRYVALGALLFTVLQQWQLSAFAGLLILLFGLFWWLRKRSHEQGSRSKHGSSTRMGKEQEEEEVKEHSDSDDTWGMVVWDDCLQCHTWLTSARL